MKTLEELREEIDATDAILFESIVKRRALVKEVGEYKKQHDLPIVDTKREEEKIQTLSEKGKKNDVPETLISQIWKILYNDAYAIEK